MQRIAAVAMMGHVVMDQAVSCISFDLAFVPRKLLTKADHI